MHIPNPLAQISLCLNFLPSLICSLHQQHCILQLCLLAPGVADLPSVMQAWIWSPKGRGLAVSNLPLGTKSKLAYSREVNNDES